MQQYVFPETLDKSGSVNDARLSLYHLTGMGKAGIYIYPRRTNMVRTTSLISVTKKGMRLYMYLLETLLNTGSGKV